MKKIISRQEFFRRCALMGLAVVGGGSLLSGCGGGGEKSGSGDDSNEATSQTTSADDPCGDYNQLTEAEVQMRTNLKYAAKSPETEKYCWNCKFYTAPEAGGPCGGCTLFKGPVHAEGYCTSWFAADQG